MSHSLKIISGVQLGLALCSILSFFSSLNPLLDLLGQFRLIFIGCSFLILAGLLVRRQSRLSLFACLILLLNVMPVYDFLVPKQDQARNFHSASQNSFTLLQFNTWASNQHPEKIGALIQNYQPDFIALEEYTPQTDHFLHKSAVMKSYPYQAEYKAGRLALFSKHPFLGQTTFTPWPPTLKVTIQYQTHALQVLVVHTWRPLHPDYPVQMQKLGNILSQTSLPLIVAGDFNTAPWGHYYKKLIDQTHLKDAENGFGLHPTYPAMLPKTQIPFPFPVLPLDHVLHSNHFQTAQFDYGPASGSDHLPILVRFTSII